MADIKITDPNPVVEEVLSKMDQRVNQTIYGPDGTPILKPLVDDRTVTYAKDGQSYSLQPLELLMRAARMLRDGWSLERIHSELDLIKSGPQRVSLRVLERAILDMGMPMLDAAIAEEREPAESVTVVGYETVDQEPDDGPEPTVIDMPVRDFREMVPQKPRRQRGRKAHR